LNNFQESVKSYKKALELDPANVQFQQALESAEQKVRESSSPQGMPDLSALLSDPAISSMAQSFAQNMMNRNAGKVCNADYLHEFCGMIFDIQVVRQLLQEDPLHQCLIYLN
jgi:hypothetical protein